MKINFGGEETNREGGNYLFMNGGWMEWTKPLVIWEAVFAAGFSKMGKVEGVRM